MSEISTSSCPTRAELQDLIAGRLSEQRHAQLEKHVSDCASCQDTLGSLDDEPAEFGSLLQEILAFAPESYSAADVELRHRSAGSDGSPRQPRKTASKTEVCLDCFAIFEVRDVRPERCPTCGAALDRNVHVASTQSMFGAQNSTIDGVEHTPEPVKIPFRAIGRYRFLRELGVGGFGSVYLALDEQLKRLVAIKIPRTHVTASRGSMERFSREYRHAAQLHHPNIIALYDVGEHDGAPYLVYEYVDGLTLKEIVRERRLDRREAATLVMEVARALDYAHSHGVIHRDVKSLNVMIDRAGHARLMDFGLAKHESHDEDLTAPGAVLGTIPYMSPEQASGHLSEVGPQSDVYSLGIVLYELLTGFLPFRGTTESIIRQVCETAPRKPTGLSPEIETDLETICLKAIAKETGERYKSAGALADDLQHWLNGEPIDAVRPSPLKRLILWRRRQPALAGLVMTVAALLVLLVVGSTSGLIYQSRMRQTVERALTEQNRLLARQYAENGIRTFDLLDGAVDQDVLRGLPWMVEAVTASRGNPEYEALERVSIASVLRDCPRLVYLAPAHRGSMQLFVLSSDRRRLLTGGDDRTAHVLDVQTGKELAAFLAHKALVSSGDIHPDGHLVATGSPDGTIEIWNIDSPRSSHTLVVDPRTPREKSSISCLKYSPDKRFIAAGTVSGKLTVRPVNNDNRVIGTSKFAGGVASIDFAPGGKLLVAAGKDGVARVFELQPWRVVAEYNAHRGPIDRVLFNPDGSRVVSVGLSDGSVHVWSARTGEPVFGPLIKGSGINALALSPNGKVLATTDGIREQLCLWDLEIGKPIGDPVSLHEGVKELVFSPDGALLATAGKNGGVRVFDSENLRRQGPLLHQASTATAVRFMGDNHGLLVATDDGCIRRFDLSRDRAPYRLAHASGVAAAALSPDGRRLATAGRATHDSILISDVSNPSALAQVAVSSEPHGALHTIAFSRDGSKIASGGDDRTVQIWDAANGRHLAGPFRHPQTVKSVQFSPDGTRLIALTVVGQAFLWDLERGTQLTSPLAHGAPVRRVAFNENGTVLAAIGGNRATFWNPQSGTAVGAPFVADESIPAADLLPAGERLLVVTAHDLVLWNRATERVIAQVAHADRILPSFAVSPRGTFFFTAGEDHSARIWRAADLSPATPSLRHGAAIVAGRFSGDERFLATVSGDGSVHVWDTRTGLLVAPPVVPLESNQPRSLEDPEAIIDLLFTPAADGLWLIRRGSELQYVNLKPVADSLETLRAAATAYSGYQIDEAGGFTPAPHDSLVRLAEHGWSLGDLWGAASRQSAPP